MGQDFGQVGQAPEVLIITVLLAGEYRMEGVVKVLVPLGVDPVSSHLSGTHNTRIVEVALGDEYQIPGQIGFQFLYLSGELFQEMDSRTVNDSMNGIDAQTVHMVVTKPH